jgi:hypothetical protein
MFCFQGVIIWWGYNFALFSFVEEDCYILQKAVCHHYRFDLAIYELDLQLVCSTWPLFTETSQIRLSVATEVIYSISLSFRYRRQVVFGVMVRGKMSSTTAVNSSGDLFYLSNLLYNLICNNCPSYRLISCTKFLNT